MMQHKVPSYLMFVLSMIIFRVMLLNKYQILYVIHWEKTVTGKPFP